MPIRRAIGTVVEKPCKQAVFRVCVVDELEQPAAQNARSRMAELRNA
jgi:hypothetical protein